MDAELCALRRAARAREMKERWTPAAKDACDAVLREPAEVWARGCARELAEMGQRMREIRRRVEAHSMRGGALQWHDTCDVKTILRDVPRTTVLASLRDTVRRILAAVVGTVPDNIQGGTADGTVYHTAGDWLFCLDDVVFGGERRQVDVQFFHVGRVPIAEFLAGVPPAMMSMQVVARAARFRVEFMLERSSLWFPVVPSLSRDAVGAFLWFVFDLPAGGTVAPLGDSLRLYQAYRDGAYAEAVFATLRNADTSTVDARCAAFPRAARPGAVEALLPILRRLCNGDDYVFRLLMRLSRWRSGAVVDAFLVNFKERLRDSLPELTRALATLLYPSMEEYTVALEDDARCVARTRRLALTVTAGVAADFHLAARHLLP